MNGYANHHDDDGHDPFGPSSASLRTAVRTFDAFPKVKLSYTEAHSRGHQFTILLLILSFFLTMVELGAYWSPHETHFFSVEKGVGHDMDFNLDIVVYMQCEDLRVHVSDQSGDRIFAMEKLKLEPTSWEHYRRQKKLEQYEDTAASRRKKRMKKSDDVDEQIHVRQVVDAKGRWWRRAYPKTAKPHGGKGDACRIFGTLNVNKVSANAHITARGHMYMEWPPRDHLTHDKINFTHIVNELSFGAYYPKLDNPLDNTYSQTPDHFFKYQYFMSIVPTLIVTSGGTEIATNQYAVTSQSHEVSEYMAPGIFFKYDIEPIQLIIQEESHSFLRFIMRTVNILSGVLVAGQWTLSLLDAFDDLYGDRIRKKLGGARSEGVLFGGEKRSV